MAGTWSVVGYPSDPIPDDPAVGAAIAPADVANWTRTDTFLSKWVRTPSGSAFGFTGRTQAALSRSDIALAQVDSESQQPVGTWDPAEALARSTTMESSGLVQWSDDPTWNAMQSIGSHMAAQPPAVPSRG